ncbi:MAG: hypothetical protein KDA66_11640 [Planctomycetaceae bacterium]|nr:hypothetical protein [Planctomycetaceae bacterium]
MSNLRLQDVAKSLLVGFIAIACVVPVGSLFAKAQLTFWIRPAVYVVVLLAAWAHQILVKPKAAWHSILFLAILVILVELVWIPRFFWIPSDQ